MIRPFVSVVIPVYNDPERLAACLECLARQTYPADRFEVVVVDNGSKAPVSAICGALSNAVCLSESRAGSYAARNLGVRNAKGEIVAFTDSDCRPESDWIERGVAAILGETSPGLVAGRVDIFFRDPDRPTWVELYEKIFAFPQEENARARHYGATANLFTTKAVLEAVGPFDDALVSGGDHEWGDRAHRAGFPVRYADDARVLHPARRDARDFFSKLRRTTYGHYALRHQHGGEIFELTRIARNLIPPLSLMRRIGRAGADLSLDQKLKAAGFLLASRYYASFLRLWLAIASETYPKPR
jgi:glycosyltransferase involved in cell wall biosynthesis